MSSEKQNSSFGTTYGSYLSERSMQPIDLETLDLDTLTLDLEIPVGAQCCCIEVRPVSKIRTEQV